MGYLTPKALDNLKYYKYSGVDRSLCVKYFLSTFWTFLLRFVPLWIAPNLITFSGFCLILINFATLVFYAPNLYEPCPPWVYISFAAGIFVYQILDNLDGRQARRTGSSSPLGELFDHGCDSLFATLSTITMYNALALTPTKSIIFHILGIIPFYMAHWEEYYTGCLILTELGNPTEAQLGMCLLHIMTALLGNGWWWQTVPEKAYQWFYIPTYLMPDIYVHTFVITVIGSLFAFGCLLNVKVVLAKIKELKVSPLTTFSKLIPLYSHVICCVTWYVFSPANISENNTILCIVFLGFLMSYTLDHMMLDRVTKIDFSILNPIYLLPYVGMIHSIFGTSAEWDVWILRGSVLFIVASYLHFVVNIVNELCTHLKIRCFKIVPKTN